jgi:dihydrodipicolinate synthase/N-acetylneuraminate lyase
MNPHIQKKLLSGCVIPAHPLALTETKQLDERHQRALSRYYLAAGAGGLAVGVHSTQFMIHDEKVGLYKPVLELAAEEAQRFSEQENREIPILIAGIVGLTDRAMREAELARDLGYHLGLVSLKAFQGKATSEMIEHVREISQVIPVMGFYLQETISGMRLSLEFWREFVEIPNVYAIKIAPFDRYQTLDVLEAVAQSGRSAEIALYTGNDDTIMPDLLAAYEFNVAGRIITLRMAGGLLGQWGCWTKRAAETLEQIQAIHRNREPVPPHLLTLSHQLTLANKAIFDVENRFAGCIAGIAYVLQQQGLMESVQTLDPTEKLSPGQIEKIDEIIDNYPHLTDDDFVKTNIHNWLSL